MTKLHSINRKNITLKADALATLPLLTQGMSHAIFLTNIHQLRIFVCIYAGNQVFLHI